MMRQRPPGPLPARPPLAPSTVSLLPTGRGGRRLPAARGPEVLPSAAAGGSEPPPLPARRGPPTLVRGRTSFWWEGSSVSRPLWGGRAAATRPPVLRGPGVSTPNSRADGRTPSLSAPPSLVPSGGPGGRRHVRSVLRGPGVSTPNSRADGRTPSFVGGDARPWGFPDGVRCAPGGDRLDSGQPPVPLGIAERPPRPPPSTTSVAASEEGRAQRIPAPATGRGKCGVQKTALSARAGGPSPSDGGLARGRCEAGSGPRPAGVRFFLESGCLGMQPKVGEVNGWGPHGLPGGFNPAGPVGPVGALWIPSVGTAARRWLGRRRAHFFRGGAPRPPGLARKGRGRWLAASGRELYRAPTPDFAATPGRGQCPRAFSPPDGRDGPLAPGVCADRADCPQSASDRAPSGRGSGPRKGCSRSAARSATHPTRLETRTKESNARASQRVSSSPHGAMKVKAAPPVQVGSPPAGRTTACLARTAGQVELERSDGTRKMVNYAWAGRSQRKLWWRPAAVLTCKSVVRPGYRGERLIEPSSSWFPPKFPSG
ncbi:hypothetical protein G5714_024745 [Onychostoma macrolepis]|uniref:Uncharacterized protein n=1 Tax=Onychostoma macrolepis TaxID=369639 RepID=A0A7J6BIQ2_9TELE|nr:hypothetical protein G5714_024745 [Onychostoma macrolepis]